MNVIIIGGPRAGECLTIPDDRRDVRLLEAVSGSFWDTERDVSRAEAQTAMYRRERFLIGGVGTVNLLVRESITKAHLHEHLAPILSEAAQAALVTP